MTNENALIPRTALPEMCAIYRQAEADIKDAFGKLLAAQNALNNSFRTDYTFNFASEVRQHNLDLNEPEKLIASVKKTAWRVLCDRMEIRRVLSQKRTAELNQQLETGNGLPEITESNILSMMESNLDQVGMYIEEAVREVYDWLIPRTAHYVTNKSTHVGNRVIKSDAVERGWNGAGYRVSHYREADLRSLDNVFHALDGNGSIKTWRGPLIEAIEKCGSDGAGETDYFRFKCHKNRNIHIEFKRQDLLDRFNAVAGGLRLHNGSPKKNAMTTTI